MIGLVVALNNDVYSTDDNFVDIQGSGTRHYEPPRPHDLATQSEIRNHPEFNGTLSLFSWVPSDLRPFNGLPRAALTQGHGDFKVVSALAGREMTVNLTLENCVNCGPRHLERGEVAHFAVAKPRLCHGSRLTWFARDPPNLQSRPTEADVIELGNGRLELERTRSPTLFKVPGLHASLKECPKFRDSLRVFHDFYVYEKDCHTWRAELKIIPIESRMILRLDQVHDVKHRVDDFPLFAGMGRRHRENAKWEWGPSRPFDGAKGSPPGMGAPGSCWDQFAWFGNNSRGVKVRLLSDSDASVESDEFEADGPQLDWKVPPPYPASSLELKKDVLFASSKRLSYSLTAAKPTTPWLLRNFHVNSWEPPVCRDLAPYGVRRVVLHHGTRLNPFINYPLKTRRQLKQYVDSCRVHHIDVAVYLTLREISSHADELPLALSLFDDVLMPGTAEFAGRRVQKAWTTKLKEEEDQALAVSGRGMWARFYERTAEFLVKCVGIAGFYVDGFAGSPAILRRLNVKIDLHAANKTLNYIELFPYVSSLWTGEANNYAAASLDHFSTAIAGVPFGVPAQMLSGALRKSPGLYYRGLSFGMTDRPGWFAPFEPSLRRAAAIWRLFDSVDPRQSEIEWSSPCKHLRVAAWGHKRLIVVIASFASTSCLVHINATFVQPEIPHLQSYAERPRLNIKPAGGRLLVVSDASFSGSHAGVSGSARCR